MLAEPSVRGVDTAQEGRSTPGCTKAVLGGRQQLRNNPLVVEYKLRIGGNESWSRGQDGVMRRVRGDWIGDLKTAPTTVNFTRK